MIDWDSELEKLQHRPLDWAERNLPGRYQHANLDMLPPERRKLAEAYLEPFTPESPLGNRQKNGLVLYGDTGTGKTFMAAAIGRELAARLGRHHWPVWREVHQLAQRLRDEIARTDLPSRRERDALIDPNRVLILDDLGAERGSDFLAEQLETVIVRRYDDCLPLVVTTNLGPDEIKTRYGGRVYSRLFEMASIVRLTGTDRRMA
jgi:DNA replication protein DnaC